MDVIKGGETMVKRVISGIVGLVILAIVFVFNNLAVINIAVTIIALLGLLEFYHAFEQKGFKPCKWPGVLLTLLILGIGYIDSEILKPILFMSLPITTFILFCKSIFTEMKFNIMDICISIFGIIYVPFLFSFLSLTRALTNGQYFIWFILAGAWLTDTCAFLVGVKFGKHKFSKISPKKSIEGCIGGAIGCMLFFGIYAYYLNSINIEMSWVLMGGLGLIISIISQFGDFAASSIKRFCEVKDFGNIMPGHGGALDRFDSVIMIAPFIYLIFQFII